MFTWIKNMFTSTEGETNMTAKIVPTEDGKFKLTTLRTGTVGTYSRRRDAVRGAKRRGFVVA
jgi:hypothetical protein